MRDVFAYRESSVDPRHIALMSEEDALWHETDSEIERGLAYGREKERLLKWVRRQAKRRLTSRERMCVEMYYLENLRYREIARRLKIHPAVVQRAVKRGLRKLKEHFENHKVKAQIRVSFTRAQTSRTRRK